MTTAAADGDVRGRAVLVAGGAGQLGGCIVRELLARGAVVFVPSRSSDKLRQLRSRLDGPPTDRLITLSGDVGNATGATTIRDAVLARTPSLHAVVASLGGWWEGELLVDLPMDTWCELLANNLTSHFVVARTFLPVLSRNPDAVYVSMGGIAATKPVPGSGPVSITGAAQRMMTRVLAEELPGRVRLHEIEVLVPVLTSAHRPPPDERWIDGRTVGTYVAQVLSPQFADARRIVLSLP